MVNYVTLSFAFRFCRVERLELWCDSDRGQGASFVVKVLGRKDMGYWRDDLGDWKFFDYHGLC